MVRNGNLLCRENYNVFTNNWAVFWHNDYAINWWRVAIMIHQNLSFRKCWKLLWATLREVLHTKSFCFKNVKDSIVLLSFNKSSFVKTLEPLIIFFVFLDRWTLTAAAWKSDRIVNKPLLTNITNITSDISFERQFSVLLVYQITKVAIILVLNFGLWRATYQLKKEVESKT